MYFYTLYGNGEDIVAYEKTFSSPDLFKQHVAPQ